MTTYNFDVFVEQFTYDPVLNESVGDISYQTLSITVPDDVTTFSFVDIPNDPPVSGELPDVGSVMVDTDAFSASLGSTPIALSEGDAEAVRVTWDNSGTTATTDVLFVGFYDPATGTETNVYAILDGTPFPTFSTFEEWDNFVETSPIGLSAITSGPFVSGQDIPFTAPLGFDSVSENDVIDNINGPSEVFGGAGDDDIRIYSDQTVYGGEGNDELYSNFGENNLEYYGGAGEDDFYAYHNNNTTIDGGDDWDFLYVEDDYNDVLYVNYVEGEQAVAGFNYGESDPEYVTFFSNIENIGIDVKEGTEVVVLGGDGNDRIRLYGDGPDFMTFFGGAGTDRVELNRIDPQEDGSRGWTLAEFQAEFAVHILDDGSYAVYKTAYDEYVAELVDVEEMRFNGESGGDDVVIDIATIATAQPDLPGEVIPGQGGDNSVVGGNGDDDIDGGLGNDTIDGGFGNDVINGGQGFDVIDGGSGNDSVSGLSGFDDISGGNGDDYLIGNSGNDSLYGDAGNDTLNGGQGNDMLFGGLDDDVLTGLGGVDSLFGGDGVDTLNGNASNDHLDGGFGDDVLNGGFGFDVLYGDDGNDTLNAGNGFDDLFGGNGNDNLNGNGGNDVMNAGNGDDFLRGGIGADEFVFDSDFGHDVVRDFSNNIDQLTFSVDVVSSFDDLASLSDVVDGKLVFTFAADHTLTLNNFTNVNALEDDVVFI